MHEEAQNFKLIKYSRYKKPFALMSFSRLVQWYHSHADPIWPDGTYKDKLADLWDVLGVDAVNGVAHVLPGGHQQGEPQQADHWTHKHVRNA